MKRMTELAHEAVRAVVAPGATVVDATVGNGHDALFLATLVGPAGRVIGIDRQEAAIASTAVRLVEAGVENVDLHCLDHAALDTVVRGPARAVMFNLGYLPGGDRDLVTGPTSTVVALRQARRLLEDGGLISVVCYRGHPGGEAEAEAVEHWAREQQARGDVVTVSGRDKTASGPFLVTLRAAQGR